MDLKKGKKRCIISVKDVYKRYKMGEITINASDGISFDIEKILGQKLAVFLFTLLFGYEIFDEHLGRGAQELFFQRLFLGLHGRDALANIVKHAAQTEQIFNALLHAELEALRMGTITAGHARALLSCEDENIRQKMLIAASEGASVRELEKIAGESKKTAVLAVFWFYITTMFFDLKSVFKLSGNSWSVISTLISSTFAKV